MQFKVPQYIDVEDKIFGPFTFRQFAYMVGGAGLCYVSWNLLPGYLAFPAVIFFGGSAGALAFIKINEKPLINILEFWFGYTFKKKLYLWKKDEQKKIEKKVEVKESTDFTRMQEQLARLNRSETKTAINESTEVSRLRTLTNLFKG